MRISLCVDVGAVEFDYGLEVGVVGGDGVCESLADFFTAELAARDERNVEDNVRVSRAGNQTQIMEIQNAIHIRYSISEDLL